MNSDPLSKHAHRVESLKDRAETLLANLQQDAPPPAPDPKAVGNEPTPEPPASAAKAEAPAALPPAPEPEAPKPAVKAAVSERERIAKALETQRKAAAERAKWKRQSGAATQAKREADIERSRVAEHAQKLQAYEQRLANAADRLAQQEELMKRQPLEFMRQRGIAPRDVYEAARQDPIQREMAVIRNELRGEVNKLAEEIRGFVSTQKQASAAEVEASERAELAQRIDSDADRFDAIGTIYSPDEAYAKANALAEEAVRLHYGWDGDRLMDELEARARKDSRYKRLRSRYAPKAKTETPESVQPAEQAPSRTTPERRAKPEPRTEVVHAQSRAGNPQNGIVIDPPRYSPLKAHRDRIDRRFRGT